MKLNLKDLIIDRIKDKKKNIIFILPEYSSIEVDLELENLSFYPDFDIFPFEDMDISAKIKNQRISTLYNLQTKEKNVILTTLHAFTRYTIPKELFKIKNFKKNDILDENYFENGYSRINNFIESYGEYTKRGFIRDIFVPIYQNPLRIELFDESIDRIAFFDPNSQKSVATIESFSIVPGSENLKFEENLDLATQRIRHAIKATGEITDIIINQLSALPGMFYEAKENLFTYLKDTEYEIILVNKDDILRTFAEKERENLEMCNTEAQRYLYKRYSGAGMEIINLIKHSTIDASVSRKYVKYTGGITGEVSSMPLVDWEDISQGDYVVHEDYGIAVYKGIDKVKTALGLREYVILLYENNSKVFVPVERIDKLSKYVGDKEGIKVSSLNGVKWKNAKKKAEEEIREKIKILLEIYAMRETQKGLTVKGDVEIEKQFQETFPYIETPDQERSIKDIFCDLETDRAMDRLLVGDAGFGKTEVAMRAAFRAVVSGFQVLLLAPTTILSKQHYENFCERMDDFGIKVELLNRHTTTKGKNDIYKDIETGKMDIVIGTHSLLSEKIKFNKLGLVIVDEEQRFGVLQKEKFKGIAEGINFLMMSATPIPRTLYMSISGLRDISTISTPPMGRLPIETYVGQFSDRLIRMAVLREKLRGGQVLYMHNRVEDLKKVYDRFREIVPEVSVAYAHGRMKKSEFMKILESFYNGELDVLVATTIVENGIDIPNVNTLIVDDSDRYGIAQLYQIKGRVGRSNKRAFAYFLYPDKDLKEDSRKRLEAIKEFNDPGSGLKLAMRDLEIRGYGDVLGIDQKGHINSIGLHLYKDILDRVLNEVKGQNENIVFEPEIYTEIRGIKGSIIIPEEYIDNSIERMRIYRRVAVAKKIEEIDDIRTELRDRFGIIPEETERLFKYAEIRIKASKMGISDITIDETTVIIKYNEELKINTPKLRQYSKKIARFDVEKEIVAYGVTDEIAFMEGLF